MNIQWKMTFFPGHLIHEFVNDTKEYGNIIKLRHDFELMHYNESFFSLQVFFLIDPENFGYECFGEK